jgi:hypothetical protein
MRMKNASTIAVVVACVALLAVLYQSATMNARLDKLAAAVTRSGAAPSPTTATLPEASLDASDPALSATPEDTTTVYITNTGRKYHDAGCRYLSRSEIPLSRTDAINQGYGPCSVCQP